ncbi:Uncharacterised protein [Yersinia rohdei]|uniref:Uncharacterized protein n=1 Tax=Yersinia rohdei TaxID=29485 RepID=A0A0U1HXD7_YERRO|nr:hypothetical protein [Yersinia rohdei]CQI96512.1 Uncharacterised protein [Yersinia rohdei]
MKVFGGACFNFSLKSIPGKIITVCEYVQEIEISLNKIHNVANIEVDYLEEDSYEDIELDYIRGDMNHGYGAYPQVPCLNVKFDIYLPYRVQSEILNESDSTLLTKSENFRVYIFETFYGMASYVEVLNCQEGSSGSYAVRVIRDFLDSEFKKIDTFLFFDFLGPSPFHADFKLISGNDIENKITMERIKIKGYDELLFNYNPNCFASDEDALSHIFEELNTELSYFYVLVSAKVRLMYRWEDIENDLNNIFLLEENKNSVSVFFRRKKVINAILKKIWIFKSEVISSSGSEKINYDSIYKRGGDVFFLQEFVDEEIESKYTYPVSDTKELVDFFESKNSKSIELFVTFITAVVGGIIGSVVTVLIS